MSNRRRFLMQAFGGAVIAGFAGSVPTRAQAFAAREPRGVSIALHGHVFNGVDLPLAHHLGTAVAPQHPDDAALIRAGAGIAEVLAWALAPSGAAEIWRLEQLARCPGFDLARSDDPFVCHDQEEADRRFRDALGMMLPRTEFFRLYLERLGSAGRACRGRSAAARLVRLADARTLSDGDVDFLMSPDGPERTLLTFHPLDAFRRYTSFRYLRVHELLRHHDGAAVDLTVPAMAPHVGASNTTVPTTPLSDQVLALAHMVRLSAGRLHPLVSFDPSGDVDPHNALALIQDAVERHAFIGVALPQSGGRAANHSDVHRLLLAWSAANDVPIIEVGTRVDDPVSFLGLRRGRGTRARLERFYEHHRIGAPRWLLEVDGAP